ncbi:geranylgeranyl reductase family protein [Desulfothermobacter acidiphilus]|uniref:geranylgeranyl reductase family protein n=1 Tax=Desulfothermobacter acidiphilus TaxID=1938353 RepID=UPI003F8B3A33
MGAGPAGARCATILAQAGLPVLLLEKCHFPRFKPCGGGLTLKAAEFLPFSPTLVAEEVIRRARLCLPGVEPLTITWNQPVGFQVRRELLDQRLAEEASAAGAFLLQGQEVVKVEAVNGTVTLTTATGRCYRAELVIGADGALSRVRRGLRSDCYRTLALVGYSPLAPPLREDRDTILIDLTVLPHGYGWVFPKADHLNVGVGSFLPYRGLRLCGEAFLSRHRLTVPTRWRAHPLALAGARTELGQGRVLLIGDAAGLVDPLTGEGLYASWLSAELAARSVLEVGPGERAVKRYREQVQASLGREYQLAQRLARLLYQFLPLIARYFVSRPEQVAQFWEFLFRGRYRELFRQSGARYWERLLRW